MAQTILVVEDEDITQDILTTWLEEAGYETCTASNGLEGLIEIRHKDPALVVADIMMPQMDGYELCRMMRELSGTPFIFLTGLGTEDHKKQGFRVGADEFLVKPVEMDHFLDRVSSLLSSPHPPSHRAVETIQVLRFKGLDETNRA